MSRLSCFPITVYFKKIFNFDGFPDSTRPLEAEMNFKTAEVRCKSGKSFIRVNL